MYTKPPTDLSEYTKDMKTERLDLDISLYDMLGAFQKLLRRKRLQRPMSTKIAREDISIEQRMTEIVYELKKIKGRQSFYDLFPYKEKDHIVVTFLAILELMKRREIIVEQEDNFSEIFVMGKDV